MRIFRTDNNLTIRYIPIVGLILFLVIPIPLSVYILFFSEFASEIPTTIGISLISIVTLFSIVVTEPNLKLVTWKFNKLSNSVEIVNRGVLGIERQLIKHKVNEIDDVIVAQDNQLSLYEVRMLFIDAQSIDLSGDSALLSHEAERCVNVIKDFLCQ